MIQPGHIVTIPLANSYPIKIWKIDRLEDNGNQKPLILSNDYFDTHFLIRSSIQFLNDRCYIILNSYNRRLYYCKILKKGDNQPQLL